MLGGFIVGFDNDDETIFDQQLDFIERTGIAQAFINILTPIPTTPLYDRLRAEGRLDFGDAEVTFRPKLMTRETLKRGYEQLLRRLYEPEAYFDRLFRGYRESPAFRRSRATMDALVASQQSLTSKVWQIVGGVRQALMLGCTLGRTQRLRRLGGAYLKIWFNKNRPLGRDALPFSTFVQQCVLHLHFYTIAHMPRKNAFAEPAMLASLKTTTDNLVAAENTSG